ncbi:MAG: hypothetical protein ACI8U3_002829 [Brevundimonas sp.]|jgi:hypothetical protein|uniref:hypothetical protein n=1 Tax=Brevundimonas sp. TaxID=1871086 RepID=UPI0039E5E5DA
MSREGATTRVQVYLSNPRVIEALNREARVSGLSLSQTAGRAVARGLARRLTADPEDRLAVLERSLRDHMRSTRRDMQIVQELTVEIARAFFLRLPDAAVDEDPVVLAAVEVRIDRMLDAVAARLISGGSVPPEREGEGTGSS